MAPPLTLNPPIVDHRYSIHCFEEDAWSWLCNGDTANGTDAELPSEIHEFANAGRIGIVETDGRVFRVERLRGIRPSQARERPSDYQRDESIT